MSRGLAIETSGRIGSIAIFDDDQAVAEESFAHGLQHAAEILPIIDRLVRQRGWTPADLQQIYVSAGPGSFTGLRIGITVAKTLAFDGGAKIVAVPSVAVLAENAPAEANHLIVVLDAKRDQIFTARFERVAGQWRQREEAHLHDLPAMLSGSPRPVHLLGEGIPYHRKFIVESDGAIVTPEETWVARAAVVGKLGVQMAARGESADVYQLTPIYVRKPEAEEKFEANKK